MGNTILDVSSVIMLYVLNNLKIEILQKQYKLLIIEKLK